MQEDLEKKYKNKKPRYIKYLGYLFLIIGLTTLIWIFYPIITTYIDYIFFPSNKEIPVEISNDVEITKNINKDTDIIFIDNQFGLYIPKIKANAKVISNVDPLNKREYTNALVDGVAHAKGTSLPNEKGNTFLFAHSSVNFYDNRNYNIYFYLLTELKKNDEIYISYENSIYKYKVLETKIVSKYETKYLDKYMEEDTLTLMTCWPAGMNVKRVIVTAIRDI